MAQNLKCTQRIRILDLICEGQGAGLCDAAGNILSYEDREKGILLDLTPIKNADGTTAINGVKTDFRLGTANQSAIAGFPSSEQEVAVNQQVTLDTPVLREIPAGSHKAIRLSISVPALFEYTDSGARIGSQILFKIEIKRSADSVWEDATADADGIGYDGVQGETLYPYVHQYRIPLKGVGPWDVRITRTTPDSTDTAKLQNELWWSSYTLVTDYKLAFRHSVVGAIEMDAKANQQIRPRAYRIKGTMVRVPSNYNPQTRCYSGVWDGQWAGCDLTLTVNYSAFLTVIAVSPLTCDLPNNSQIQLVSGGKTYEAYTDGAALAGDTTLNISPIPVTLTAGTTGRAYVRKWTNNPAFIWFDIATAKRYGVGNYIKESSIDIWELYKIARYCDGVDADGNFVGVDDGRGGVEPRFACNVYLGTSEDAYKVLSDLASAFRGMIYWGAGLIIPVQDSPKTPDFTFTNANVIDGTFTYSGSARKSRHTLAFVRWNDPDDYYKAKLEQVPGSADDMKRLGIRDTTVSAFGCTSRSQAKRIGKWLLLTEKHEQETVVFRGGLEVARCRPGTIIRIRDRDETVSRLGGRVRSIGAGTVELDAPAEIGADYSLLVTKDDGNTAELPVVNAPGTYQTLTVTGSLVGISPNAVWVLRSPDLEPTIWRVLNVKELERNIFEVSALKYVGGKFAEVEDGIEITEPKTGNLPPVVVPNAVATITITDAFVKVAEKMERQLNVSWTPATGENVVGYMIEWRSPGREWDALVQQTDSHTLDPITVSELGTYSFRVTTVGNYNLKSQPAEESYVLGEVTAPDAVADFAVVGVPGGFKLTWTDNLADRGFYRIYESATTTQPTSPSTTTSGGNSEANYGGFTAPSLRYFWIEPVLYRVDLAGPVSGPISATSQDPSAKLVVLTSDSQTFQIAKDGTISPASITFTATGQNVSGTPTFSVVSGTATLTGTGSTRALAPASMTTDAITVKVTWDGWDDFVSIVKVREGSDAIVAFLTNEAHTVPADSSGVVTSWTGASTSMKVFRGATDDTANWTITKAETSLTGTLSGATYTASAMGADVAYCDLTASRSGYPSITKRFTVTKSKAGATGAAGATGSPGPGLVYVGAYNSSTVYYCTSSRVDVVSYGGSYYRASNAAKSGTSTWSTPGSADWSAPDATYRFVASALLLAEDATITKTLVMGDGTNGLIRSYTASAFGTGTGYWLGPDGKARFGNPSGNRIEWDGSNIKAYSDYAELGTSYGTKVIIDQDTGFVGPGTAARLRFGTITLKAITGSASSIELSDGTIKLAQGSGFTIGNFVVLGGGAWWGIQTGGTGEARFPGNLRTAGDIYLGMNSVARWLYDCDGNNLLKNRYSTASPGSASDLSSVIALANWCKDVITYHGIGV